MKKIGNRLAKFLSLLCCSCMIFAGSACDSAALQSEDNTSKTDISDTSIDLTVKEDPLFDKTAPEGETEKGGDEESPADKTDPEEESPKKDGEDSEEEEKGEKEPTVSPDDSKVTFRDIGEEFQIVAKPLYDAAQAILNDLIAGGKVSLSREHNPRIVAIRYFYGHSFQINIRQDIYVNLAGDVSEFLQQEYGYSLENFRNETADGKDEGYAAYYEFLRMERSSQNDPNYVKKVLPYAEKSAALILKGYRSYKESERFELKTLNYGKQLILRKASSLSETYEKIIGNLNGVLSKRGYPLLTDQDLDIGFGGTPAVAAYVRWIIIEAHIGSLCYTFYISFNENGEIPQETINYFEGTMMMGYTPSNPDALNPPNEEYAEFFARLGIEKIDLSDIQNTYKYDGVGSALYQPDGEATFLYF